MWQPEPWPGCYEVRSTSMRLTPPKRPLGAVVEYSAYPLGNSRVILGVCWDNGK